MYAQQNIFAPSYTSTVLGLNIPITESLRMSPATRYKILEAQEEFDKFWEPVYRLDEGFFGDFVGLGKQLKNTALTLRYIIGDSGLITKFVDLCVEGCKGIVDGVFGIVDTLDKVFSWIGKKITTAAKLTKPLKFLLGIRDKIKDLMNKVKSMSGWKQALLGVGGLVGLTFLWKKIKKNGGEMLKWLNLVVEKYLPHKALTKACQTINDHMYLVETRVSRFMGPGGDLLLEQVLVNELFGFGKKKKKDKKKSKKNYFGAAYKGKDKEKEVDDKTLEQRAEAMAGPIDKIQDFIETDTSLMEDIMESEEMNGLKQSFFDMVKGIGKKALKAIGAGALLGMISGGVVTFFKAAAAAFGGLKLVMGALKKPMEKFTAKMKGEEDVKDEAKEAQAGENDPTDESTQKEEKKESIVRDMVRQTLLDSYGTHRQTRYR